MESRRIAFLAVAGSALALGAGAAGYAIAWRAEPRRPAATVSPAAPPAASHPPTAAPAAPAAAPTPQVLEEAATNVAATPGPSPKQSPASPTRTPTPSPAPAATHAAAPTIRFVALPPEVRSGQTFTVEWRVEGPAGANGERAAVRSSYRASASGAGSSASSSSTSTQSFGTFTVPKTFSVQLSYGGASGTIFLTASAQIGGQTISTDGAVRLVP